MSRAQEGPLARVELSPDLPDPSLDALLVLFVLTCDHALADTLHGG